MTILQLARLAVNAAVVVLALADWSGRTAWRAVSGVAPERALVVTHAARLTVDALPPTRSRALRYLADPSGNDIYVFSSAAAEK